MSLCLSFRTNIVLIFLYSGPFGILGSGRRQGIAKASARGA